MNTEEKLKRAKQWFNGLHLFTQFKVRMEEMPLSENREPTDEEFLNAFNKYHNGII